MSAPTAPGRRERRKQEIHDRLLDAARELFDEQGLEETTVGEICARADVAEKTFFNHFATKQHVVREIAQVFFAELAILVEQSLKQPGTTADRLAYLFDHAAQKALGTGPRHKEVLLAVIRDAQSDSSDAKTRWVHATFRTILVEGAAAGELTEEHDVEFLTEMVLGVFTAILLNWQRIDDYPLRKHFNEAARFLARAIARDEPRARPKRRRR